MLLRLVYGGNDLPTGKFPERGLDEFKDFVATVRQKLSTTEIVFIGLSPGVMLSKQK